MRMKSFSKKLKIISLMLAAIAVFTVSPTLAWLSATATPVVNYFAGGAIAIKIDEAPVDTDGHETTGDRVQENHYKYTAGAVLDKDPTVTVLANSEDCYVYVCVDNELPSTLFAIDINTTAWEYVATSGNMTIYRYFTSVANASVDQSLVPVFEHVTVSSALTADDITSLGDMTLTVTAYAIQTESLTTSDADSLAMSYFLSGNNLAALTSTQSASNAALWSANESTVKLTDEDEEIDLDEEESEPEENSALLSTADSGTSESEETESEEEAVDIPDEEELEETVTGIE
ncbi:MAG: hypothetical protein LUH18_07985 [Oscillospiraceae bacterium]|nr:hypothetical protein [Oscillospiraceae bacterium]